MSGLPPCPVPLPDPVAVTFLLELKSDDPHETPELQLIMDFKELIVLPGTPELNFRNQFVMLTDLQAATTIAFQKTHLPRFRELCESRGYVVVSGLATVVIYGDSTKKEVTLQTLTRKMMPNTPSKEDFYLVLRKDAGVDLD